MSSDKYSAQSFINVLKKDRIANLADSFIEQVIDRAKRNQISAPSNSDRGTNTDYKLHLMSITSNKMNSIPNIQGVKESIMSFIKTAIKRRIYHHQ